VEGVDRIHLFLDYLSDC